MSLARCGTYDEYTAMLYTLQKWLEWSRRTSNTRDWMKATDWSVWEARKRQKTFYDWWQHAGLRAEDESWMGYPPWMGQHPKDTSEEARRNWTERLIVGGVKHRHILLEWASKWYVEWSPASVRRRREALNAWRIWRSARKRVSMWRDRWNTHDVTDDEDEDDYQKDVDRLGGAADGEGAGQAGTITGQTRMRWSGSNMTKAAEWYTMYRMAQTLRQIQEWSAQNRCARAKLKRREAKRGQKKLREETQQTERWNEMHEGRVRQVTVRTATNGIVTVDWSINNAWEDTMEKMDAADELRACLERAEHEIEARARDALEEETRRKTRAAVEMREALEAAERAVHLESTYKEARERIHSWWKQSNTEVTETNNHNARMEAAHDIAEAAFRIGAAGGAIARWHKAMATEREEAAQRARDKWDRKFTHPKLLRSFPPNCTQTYGQSSEAMRGSSDRRWWESLVRNRDMPMKAGWRQSREELRARGLTPARMHVTRFNQPDWAQQCEYQVRNSIMTAAPATVPEESEGRKVTAFVGWIGGHKVVIGVDTYAEVSLVSKRITSTTWRRTTTTPLKMAGLGTATVGDRVEVPVQFRTKEAMEHIFARESETQHLPPGIDLLIGTKDQRRMKMKIDQGNDRLEIRKTTSGRGIVIDLETAKTLRRRMSAPGLKVLDLASGSSSPALILQDLGWNISKWVACEIDGETRQVAEGLCPKVRHASHDLLKMAKTKSSGRYDLILSATPCKGFSNANDKATGMDGEDGDLLKAAAGIIDQAMGDNPQAKFLVENVALHRRFAHQAEEQDNLFKHLDAKFKLVKASDNGASQIRSRRIATNIVEVEKIERKDQLDPNALLGDLASAQERDTPCIMAAGSTTRAPVIVKDATNRRKRPALNDEKEALQGYPVGMSRGFRIDIGESKRTKVIGNAWNYHQMSAIFRHLKPQGEKRKQYSMHAVRAEEIDGISSAEKRLLSMSHEERAKHFEDKMEGYELAKLKVTLKDEQTVPWQVPQSTRMNTPSGKREAAVAEIKLRLKRGHLKLVRYKRKQWIAAMFCKGKNRINPETLLEAIRLLTDFRKLNSASDWPKQWNEYCPTISGIKDSIPANAKWFATEDISDAYEGATVTPESRHFLTAAPPVPINASMFTDEELEMWGSDSIEELREAGDLLVEWSGMPQGLAVSATFFNCHLADGMNQLLGGG